jgi:CIC family chloride channel protein
MKWFKFKKLTEINFRKQIKDLIYFLRTSDASYFLVFSILIGTGAGFGAIFFRWLILQINKLFFVDGGNLLGFMGHYYVILIPALGGLLVGPVVHFFAREAKGHGVPEVINAMVTNGGRIRPRVAVIKTLASAICIGSGGSAGREGPIIQIGSALGSSIGQLFNMTEDKTRTLVACGAGAGIAATFNAPLGGIFFALEVILREYGLKNFSSVVLSSVTATVISRSFLGDHPAFQTPPFQLYSIADMPYYFVFSLFTALAALLFIKTLYKTEDIFNIIKMPPYLKPALGGLMIGGIGLFFPQVFGVGYDVIENTINGELVIGVIVALVFLKILATSITLGSGGSGGIFAPSLLIGALLGEAFGKAATLIIPSTVIPPGAFALVGMAAVFAGTSHAPISAILLLFEMTGNYQILPPLMVTCVISVFLVRWISKPSIYTLKLLRRGIDVEKHIEPDLMDSIIVSDAMIKEVIAVNESDTVRNVGLKIKKTNHRGFPVLSDEGKLVGMVTRQDINHALQNGDADTEVKNVMTKDIMVCFPNESLKTALNKMAKKNIGRIPVVKQDSRDDIIGILTRKSIINAYNLSLDRMSGKN